jgi:ATP-dependent DNA helicase RecG
VCGTGAGGFRRTSTATINAVPLQLSTPVKFIKRVGDRIAAGLAERGVSTVEDLLYHLPFRYEDRLHPRPLSLYQPGDMASLIGEVRGTVLLRTRSGPIFEMTVGIKPPAADSEAAMEGLLAPPPSFGPAHFGPAHFGPAHFGPAHFDPAHFDPAHFDPAQIGYPEALASGLTPNNKKEGALAPGTPSPIHQPIWETVKCMWFHGSYLKDKFHPGQSIALYGKLEGSRSGNALHAPPGSTRFKMIQPTFEILPDAQATGDDAEFTMLEMGRIVPVYESLGGKTPWGAKLTSRWMRRVMWTVFRELTESAERENSVILSAAESTSSAKNPVILSAAATLLHRDAAESKDPPARSNRQVSPSLSGSNPATQNPGASTTRSPSQDAQSSLDAQSETLPHALRERLALPSRMEALQALHFPPAGTSMTELMSARTPAHRRLIFEEFFYLELGLELKRRRLRERAGTVFTTNDSVRQALKQVLPFKPTAAQKRVLGEIVGDMRRPQPMRRLLQGDVGSGKTIVAFQAALVAIENGYQVALMVPTEILATQHYLSARKLLGDVLSPRTGRPYRIALLTGSLDDRAKRETRGRIFRGEIDLAIGTHALVEEKVDFANLGLVIVDEQHRFGVQQRFQLMRKPNSGAPSRPLAPPPNGQATRSPSPSAQDSVILSAARSAQSKDLPDSPQPQSSQPLSATEPDVLVMTATPIPRTLALTLYGDLDASVIDELPPGRSPILTRRMPEERSAEVWDFVRKQVAAGRQAYIVYPVIEGGKDDQPELDFALEPEATEPTTKSPRKKAQRPKLRSATEMHEELGLGPLKGLRLGLLHGRMSADDKEITMARFKRGEIDVLVSTTVIEVGVDVANATVMVIEHAERFGLAQMHQLRGRVGRGAAKSYCVLLTGSTISTEAEQRLDAMVRTQNGFELAEIDLQQRGPGEFFGTRQAGLPEFRVANLARDRDLLELAKLEAAHFAESPDPTMPRAEIDAVWSRLKHQWQRRYGLVEA